MSWAQALEYRRPTADANGASVALRTAACYSGSSSSSSSNSAVYTGKSGAGPTGASATQTITNSSTPSKYKIRVFTTWQSASTTYTNLTVSASLSCDITDNGDGVGGTCGAAYSTDNGSTWTTMWKYTLLSGNSTVQTTYTANITGTPLSGVQVGVCALAASDPGAQGTDVTITTYDVWTTGTTSSPTSGYVMRPYERN